MTNKTPHSITFYISKGRKGFYDRALKALDINVSRYIMGLINVDFTIKGLINLDGAMDYKVLAAIELEDDILLKEVKRRGLLDE